MNAQSYSSLWKQVAENEEKDLPRTQQKLLRQIVAKAESDKNYGHLLKAELKCAMLNSVISPDSLSVEVERIKTKLESLKSIGESKVITASDKQSNIALTAIYQSVLARIYQQMANRNDVIEGSPSVTYKDLSDKYYQLSMGDLPALSVINAKDYEPFIIEGVDSRIFYNDLLHVLGFEAKAYSQMYEWYKNHNNRPASCICALFNYRQKYSKANIHQSIIHVDSLINEYQDLKECGELAIEHYSLMEQMGDVSAEDKMNYINYALSKWGAWPRMNILRNAQNQLTLPSFSVSIGSGVSLPNMPRKVVIRQIVNVQSLTMNVTRVKTDGMSRLNVNDEGDYAKIKKMLVLDDSRQSITHRYIGQPAYKVQTDSMEIGGLPVGVYLVEFTTNHNSIKPERALLHVSDMYAMWEHLPDNKIRFAVVSATTGQPIKGAKIQLLDGIYHSAPIRNNGGSEESVMAELECNEIGEATYQYKNRQPSKIYVYTDKDRYCPDAYLNGNFTYYDRDMSNDNHNLYTDRKIYRPGQTVHVAFIAFKEFNHQDSKVKANEKFSIDLKDANHETIATHEVVTDEYGSASTDFVLPLNRLTGQYSVSTHRATTYFSVEEYKQPTFQILFDDVNDKYSVDDSVTVKGKAIAYTGLPIQEAKVAVKVTRSQSLWWKSYGISNDIIKRDTIKTDNDGAFTITVPMKIPENVNTSAPYYFSFNIEAQVTDERGESHEGSIRLPLSNREAVLTIDLPEKIEVDSSLVTSFSYLNTAGKKIDQFVTYYIDDPQKTVKVKTNQDLELHFKGFTSGKHTLYAECGDEKIKKEFIVFSIHDQKPIIETHDWFYASSDRFPNDGKPVHIQMGASDLNQHIVYSIICGKKVIESGVVDQSNALYNREFVYKEEYGDGILFNCAWVREGKLYSHKVSIQRPVADKKLHLEWKTFRDHLTSGQSEEWTLSIKDSEGKPVSAQLMAVLYDKSLDQLRANKWSINPRSWQNIPYTTWNGRYDADYSLYGELPYKLLNERPLTFSRFDETVLEFVQPLLFRGTTRGGMKRLMVGAMAKSTMNASVATSDNMAMEEVAAMDVAGGREEEKASNTVDQIRSNFNETAFFYPSMYVGEDGIAKLSFTLPESVTTWKFMGLAHDQDIRYGYLESEVIASKTVIVQPNMPRFLRADDSSILLTRVSNTSDKTVSGNVIIELIDPDSEKVLYKDKRSFTAESGKTNTVEFNVAASQLPSLTICRIQAVGNGFSDGEQHLLPVLSNKEMVTNTVAITQNKKGTKTINLKDLFPQNSEKQQLTIEYTNNPDWMMIQALPAISTPINKDVLSVAAAFYANSLAAKILHRDSSIEKVVEKWAKEQQENTSSSALMNNQELKSILVEETPWLTDAHKEAEQKSQLVNYFDNNMLQYRLDENIKALQKLQDPNGAWSWWPGMKGSIYMTTAVCEILVRLNAMIGSQAKVSPMLDKAFTYMGGEIVKEVDAMKKAEQKDGNVRLSATLIRWLYICSIDGRDLPSNVKKANQYLIEHLTKSNPSLSIYDKAVSAVILAKNKKANLAQEMLQSIKEYSVSTEENGRYFDTSKAPYSWFDYKIPTEVAAIEAIQLVNPSDTTTVKEMQLWLLQEKRTQSWDTPINSVNAIYAFLNGQEDVLNTENAQPTVIKMDKTRLEGLSDTESLGYFKASLTDEIGKTLSFKKEDNGVSWGAVYAQFVLNSSEITGYSSGMKITKDIVLPNKTVRVGDKIRIRIIVETERDYDFVQITDKRAACLEPTEQLSGYRNGYYYAPKQNVTNYFFDRLPKGKHVIETDYFVDRLGTFHTGSCMIQCAYSPEFVARAPQKTIQVNN